MAGERESLNLRAPQPKRGLSQQQSSKTVADTGGAATSGAIASLSTDLGTINTSIGTSNTGIAALASVDADPHIAQAINVILSTYGDTVSVASKAKNLDKFGRTNNADSGVRTTVGQFQGTVVNETFVTTNLIDSIVSDSAMDTMGITIEGHTIDGSGNLTFVTQTATLNGMTEVTLTTPMARANRAYVSNSGSFGTTPTAPVGTVYVYDNTGGILLGVPLVAAATKCLIEAGQFQTRKAATSISSTDYWLLQGVTCGINRSGGATANADFDIEIRDVANGGAWRPIGLQVSLRSGSLTTFRREFSPYKIVPKNHDVRVIVTTDTADQTVTADIAGVLAIVV